MTHRPAASGRPRVTVVIPCYNYGRFLPACLASVLEQPGLDVDALVVDDASPDGSGEVAEALAAADPRVRVLRHGTNRGHIATYNDGLALAEGTYVTLLSADDLLTPGSLTRSVALLEANPGVGMAYGHPRLFHGEHPPAARTGLRGWRVWPGREWIELRCRRGTNCVYSPEAVLRNEVQQAVGGYRPQLPHSADMEMWLRVAAVSDIGRVNGPDQAFRRIHGSNMSETTYAGVLADLRARLDTFDAFFAAEGAALAGADRLRQVAHRRLAVEALEHAGRALDSEHPACSSDAVESARAFAAFATAAYPGVQRFQQWRLLTPRLRLWPQGPGDEVRRRAFATHRDLAGRVRFRRWLRSGV